MKTTIQASRCFRDPRRPVRSAYTTRRPGRLWRAAAIAATLGCASASAHARSFFDIEVGLGKSNFHTVGNGTWYQEGEPYTLDLKPPAFEVGLTGNLYTHGRYGLDWHIDYDYLGSVQSESIDTTDENYNASTHSCRGACVAQTRFTGHGNVSGIALTLEPNYSWHGVRFGAEAGPFIFLPSWTETLTPANEPANVDMTTVHLRPGVRVGAVVGLSIGHKNFTFVYQHFFDKSTGDYEAIWSSTNLVMVRYRF